MEMAMESGPARLAMIVAAISFAQVRVGAILLCRIIPGNLFNEYTVQIGPGKTRFC